MHPRLTLNCGLFISIDSPFIAATPNGVVTCESCVFKHNYGIKVLQTFYCYDVLSLFFLYNAVLFVTKMTVLLTLLKAVSFVLLKPMVLKHISTRYLIEAVVCSIIDVVN